MKYKLIDTLSAILTVSFFITSPCAHAAIALDRTRIVFDGGTHSMSLTIENQNKELPYLAQAWLENNSGQKVDSPLVALPPLQRVEPGTKSLLKIQALPAANALPQDRETLFYFNLREVPPKTNKANTIQIALQTRIKLFFRPQAISADQQDYANPWQQQLTLTREGDTYRVHNPTPYYVTLASVSPSLNAKNIENFNPLMVEPKGSALLTVKASQLGAAPVINYINDFGGRPSLIFSCNAASCVVKEHKIQ